MNALTTDLYQLTMAYGYWKNGMADREAVFHLFFRNNPFESGFAIAAGLEQALEYLEGLSFEQEDLDYLASLTGADGKPMFERAFLDYLRDVRFHGDLYALREGSLVFAREPLLRVHGSLLQTQLVETALLTIVNFQTLIATKAARVCLTAQAPVLEFGMRRAQGLDGALSASRAAFLGGCEATSNVLAGKKFGIPVRGTHAHSWVMAFDSERVAFAAYAEAMPNNALFLVDTYDSLEGVRNAVAEGKLLRAKGHEMLGIRLDSGDLAWLSVEARRILDAEGFPDAKIVATNDLDEVVISSLKAQGAKIDIWGVGTRLVTGYDQPALGGVYKLGAIRGADGSWQPKMKVSSQKAKTTLPGVLQVRRYRDNGLYRGDMIYDELAGKPGATMIDPLDATLRRTWSGSERMEDLLQPVLRGGARLAAAPALAESREFALTELASLHPAIKRILHPHVYPVGVEQGLHDRVTRMILALRGSAEA